LIEELCSFHICAPIDSIFSSFLKIFGLVFGSVPKYSIHGGCTSENTALENLQARIRMVLSYLFAQLLPLVRNKSSFLLVLAASNADESVVGYLTKYDCSSGDLNPIGSLSKEDIRCLVLHMKDKYDLCLLQEFLEAKPSAELNPSQGQTDEQDIGLSYDKISIFNYARKVLRCGPLSMLRLFSKQVQPDETMLAEIKTFFIRYWSNRHKMATLTPSYHASSQSPEDHRFDMRPMLYPTKSLVSAFMRHRKQSL
jgi:NAD+ synthase (glutamine-hydrolysing)